MNLVNLGKLKPVIDSVYEFGDILEAVIITDKNTGKSKGYGFVFVPIYPLISSALTTKLLHFSVCIYSSFNLMNR